MRYCVIILDGASGWPLDSLGGRTTLATADTPCLDGLASRGLVGMARTVPPGMEPSSSAACMSILGYDPVADYIGRGAIEAASLGIELSDGDVALRLNLVTLDQGRMASYSAGHIGSEDSHRIIEELAREMEGENVSLYPGVAYRHILVVRGRPELERAAYFAPHDISDQETANHLPTGDESGFLLDLMERARPVLRSSQVNRERIERGDLPATDVWPFWPGVKPQDLVAFEKARRLRAAMTSGVDLLRGLAVLTGIERLDIPGVTDGHDNDYVAQADGAIEALGDHEVVFVHVESPDEAGHAGDAKTKIEAIEAIDREIVSRIASLDDVRILAMPDHPTPVATKTHAAEPVPFVLAGPGVEPGRASRFDELSAREEKVLVDPGRGVMDLLLGA